jgi:DNA repair protein RecN (Recombination protein N)
MLKELHIKNYAIIDELSICFSAGLNIITGETGAGKSIIMGALGLMLGNRADSSILLKENTKCIVEGVYNGEHLPLRELLKEYELDELTELNIRREITPNGKSRAFVNDTPVTLQQLKTITAQLVDLHQQFDTLELGKDNFQLSVIDALAANASLLTNYQSIFKNRQLQKQQLTQLKEQQAQFNREADYNRFLLEELEQMQLQPNELEQLESELQLLNNSEGIKNLLQKIYYELKETDTPITGILKQQINQLAAYSKEHSGLKVLLERLQSVQIELQDIAQETSLLNDTLGFDESRIQFINERLSIGYRLQKKHGVQSTAELLAIQAQLSAVLLSVLQLDEQLSILENSIAESEQYLLELSNKLTAARIQQINPLVSAVNQLLTKVGMPNARLKIESTKTDFTTTGTDHLQFLFDANKSNKFEPIGKVASGGELSRLMLCIKSLVAEKIDLATLIFDEIDTGISGEAAKQVGIILKQLGNNRQIICITHQPQIASKATAHYLVFKETKNNTITTRIRQLEEQERINIIATMLGGEQPSKAALQSAYEMMH